jgi:hypothetical protein
MEAFSQVENDVRYELWYQVNQNHVEKRGWNQVWNQVQHQVRNYVWDNVRSQVFDKILDRVTDRDRGVNR